MNAATDRRAIFGALLTAGAVAVIPAAASGAPAPTLTAIDRDVLDLWSQRDKLKEIDAASDAVCDLETKLDKSIGASVLALGGVLVMEISNGREDAEDIPGLYRAMLAAIRPRLVGLIAEDADRVLAEAEEDA